MMAIKFFFKKEKNLLWNSLAFHFFKKLNIQLPYGLAVSLLSMYTMESEVGTQTDTYVLMFVAALFTIAKK